MEISYRARSYDDFNYSAFVFSCVITNTCYRIGVSAISPLTVSIVRIIEINYQSGKIEQVLETSDLKFGAKQNRVVNGPRDLSSGVFRIHY